MPRRLLIAGLIALVPFANVEGQQSGEQQDSTESKPNAVSATAGIGSMGLGMFTGISSRRGGTRSRCGNGCNLRGASPSFVYSPTAPGLLRYLSDVSDQPSPRRRDTPLAATLAPFQGAFPDADDATPGSPSTRHELPGAPLDLASTTDERGVTGSWVESASRSEERGAESVGVGGFFIPSATLCAFDCAGSTTATNGADATGFAPASDIVWTESGVMPAGLSSPPATVLALDNPVGVNVIVNPEPGTIALTMIGLGAVAFARGRRVRRD